MKGRMGTSSEGKSSGAPDWGTGSLAHRLQPGCPGELLTGVFSSWVLWLQANLKKFMDYVQTLNVEKVSRLVEKGLDPNFHDPDTGGEMEGGWGVLGVEGHVSSRHHGGESPS